MICLNSITTRSVVGPRLAGPGSMIARSTRRAPPLNDGWGCPQRRCPGARDGYSSVHCERRVSFRTGLLSMAARLFGNTEESVAHAMHVCENATYGGGGSS